MGQALANNVGQSAQTAQGALAQNVADYQNQFSSLPTEAQADQNIQNTLTNTEQDTVGSAPVTQYQGYLNDTQSYSNPQTGGAATTSADPATLQTINGANGTNDYANTQQDYTTAANNLADTQSESGRDILLQNQYGQDGQSYNQGEQSFDQLLLQQNPANAQALQSVYQQYNPTVGIDNNAADAAFGQSADLYGANQAATTQAANVATTNTAIQTDAQNALQAQIGTDTTGINSELAAAQAAQNSQYGTLQQSLDTGSLSPLQLQGLGLNPNQNLYGVTAGQVASFLNPESSPVTADQAATSQDFTNANALQLLAAGQNYSQSANLGLTGTAPESANTGPTYNVGGLDALIGANQGAYNQAVSNFETEALQNESKQASNSSMAGQINSGSSLQQMENYMQTLANEEASTPDFQATGGNSPTAAPFTSPITDLSQLNAALDKYNTNETLSNYAKPDPLRGVSR